MCKHNFEPAQVLVNPWVAVKAAWRHIPVKELPPGTTLFKGPRAVLQDCNKCTKCGYSVTT